MWLLKGTSSRPSQGTHLSTKHLFEASRRAGQENQTPPCHVFLPVSNPSLSGLWFCACSYLYPDGRDVNPELTCLCEAAQKGKVQVTEVKQRCLLISSIVSRVLKFYGNLTVFASDFMVQLLHNRSSMSFTVRSEAPLSCVRSVQRGIKTPASSPVGIFCASLVSQAGRYSKPPHLLTPNLPIYGITGLSEAASRLFVHVKGRSVLAWSVKCNSLSWLGKKHFGSSG